jgi:hypothetical protein
LNRPARASADAEETRFGLEIEYALAHPARGFMDFANSSFSDFGRIVERLPDDHDPDLTRGDLAIKWTRWYVEGDERFDDDGRFLDCAPKGIETRTPIQPDIDAALAAAGDQTDRLAAAAARDGAYLVTIGYNPIRDGYHPTPPFNRWELAMRAAHPEYAAPEVYMLSYGPDVNLSNPGWDDAAIVDIARKLTYYSAAMVAFSLNAPFAGGRRVEGYSARIVARAGRRPAARAFVAPGEVAAYRPDGGGGVPFVTAARIPAERGRIEFKAFDPVPLPDYGALLALVAGVALDTRLAGRADTVDARAQRRVARAGFTDAGVRDASAEVLWAAREALPASWAKRLDPLEEALAARRTPADALIERHAATGELLPAPPAG